MHVVKYFELIAIVFIAFNRSLGHTNGHGTSINSYNSWNLLNQENPFSANFLYADDNEAIFQSRSGYLVHYKISEFILSDQKKIKQVQANTQGLNKHKNSSRELYFLDSYLPIKYFAPLITLLLILIVYWIYQSEVLFVNDYKIFPGLIYQAALPVLLISLMVLPAFISPGKTSLVSDLEELDRAFDPFRSTLATSSNEDYYFVESLGFPDHEMMVGITNWQQQVPIPQCYIEDNAWQIPLNPVVAKTPVSLANTFFRGAIGLATNGVPIFNALNNRGEDAFLIGELDNFGGHCGMADDYHYHIAPLHLDNATEDIIPIAYALDGFAVYADLEPDGADMRDLDENNGHFDDDGAYHYHGTDVYPYMVGAMVGEVESDDSDQIIPQASSKPIRPGQSPLMGAAITGFELTTPTSAKLTYTVENEIHTIDYSWDETGSYDFTFNNPDGSVASDTFQSFIPCQVEGLINGLSSLGTVDRCSDIYPNPSDGNISIDESEAEQMDMYDVHGNLISKNREIKANRFLDISELSSGIYFIVLKNKESQPLCLKRLVRN